MFEAFFLPAEPGERFCIYHPAAHGAAAPRGIVYVHPFAEEMNKARRMAALQCRQLAAAGCAVLQVDLFGCGDSSGDFADARWEIWKKDVRAANAWLRQRVQGGTGLWGLRLGAVLAAQVACDPSLALESLLLWQPVGSGEQFLTQFLRMRLAAEMLSAGSAQTKMGELRTALHAGAPLEVAGYELNPELAAAIEGLQLADLVPRVSKAYLLEVSATASGSLSAGSQRTADAWRAKGVDVHAVSVAGEPFWSTVEITECPALLSATAQLLQP